MAKNKDVYKRQLLMSLARKFKTIRIEDDHHSLKVSLDNGGEAASQVKLNRSNWKSMVADILKKFKEDGFCLLYTSRCV